MAEKLSYQKRLLSEEKVNDIVREFSWREAFKRSKKFAVAAILLIMGTIGMLLGLFIGMAGWIDFGFKLGFLSILLIGIVLAYFNFQLLIAPWLNRKKPLRQIKLDQNQ